MKQNEVPENTWNVTIFKDSRFVSTRWLSGKALANEFPALTPFLGDPGITSIDIVKNGVSLTCIRMVDNPGYLAPGYPRLNDDPLPEQSPAQGDFSCLEEDHL